MIDIRNKKKIMYESNIKLDNNVVFTKGDMGDKFPLGLFDHYFY